MKLLRMVMLLLCAAAAGSAGAQSWPSKPVHVIVPFPPGAGAENAARLVSNHWAKAFGQPFLIEARPGGNTMIGAEAAAKSAPAGYTLFLCAASTMVSTPALLGAKSPINAQRDFVPVGLVSRLPFFLVVPASVPVQSVQELIALAKAKPGEVTYASNGNGTAGHLGFEILKRQFGISLTHIPYKGYGQALHDLLGGRVTTMMADLVVVGPTIKDGRLRALAVTSLERTKFLPNLPTMVELGFPGYEIVVWFGVFAPAGTPPDIVTKLNAEMRKYLSTPEAREGYERLGHEPAPSTADELRVQMVADAEKYGKIIREAGVKLE